MKGAFNYMMIKKQLIAVILVEFSMISTAIVLPSPQALPDNGFSKGVSWTPIVPLKKITFVDFDENNLLDDYSYLASIPTSVFYDKNDNKIYSHPLLYYQDPYPVKKDKERSLNARQGLDYFMEDWMGYCNGRLDGVTLINVPKEKVKQWPSRNVTVIDGDDPYSVASQIALNDWSYSDRAVLAVIKENYSKPNNITEGSLKGIVTPKEVKKIHFEVPKTNEVYPIYNEFNVPEGYKLLKVRSWYPCFYFEAGIPGFEGLINMSIPAGDRDLQVYCDMNGRWMMAGITNGWNAKGGMDIDKTSVYVYKNGRWSVAITDVPTKALDINSVFSNPLLNLKETGLEVQKHHSFLLFHFGRYGRIIDILKNMKHVTYQVDVEMYPGVELTIPDRPTIGCRDAKFILKWNNPNVHLGFSLIGPNGEEILSTREPGVSSTCPIDVPEGEIPIPEGTKTDLKVYKLGECLDNESYKICVYSLDEITNPVDFTIEYSWKQNYSRVESNCLTSATEGSILASELNIPLLYINTDSIPKVTLQTLYTLGVKQVYLVNIGDHLSDEAKRQLIDGFSIKQYTTDEEIYNDIRSISNSNDVVFSTITPWNYWYVAELKPAGEEKGSRFIGPAAYIAAHHGTPVLFLEEHPELSSASVWHTELWRRHPDGYTKLPTVSEMYLTGTRVYNFLNKLGFDREGMETIITVAGQFNIGFSWDRTFVGKAKPGRFFGSPVDVAVWITKNVFYPMLIFENPATNDLGVTMINGSKSIRRFPWRGKLGLKIVKPSEKESFKYPILDTLICYDHKFNSRASKYWGFKYKCADGSIPGESPSFEEIDQGVMKAVNGKEGAFLPDLSGSEVQPFYIRKAGCQPVFSTNFSANMYNLNQGVLLWMVNTHGAPLNGGMFMFWDVKHDNPVGYPPIPLASYNKEPNPWRGYEWLMGSTSEPDTMTMEIHGVLPALFGNPNPKGIRILTTALDWAAAKRPIRDILGEIASLPILRYFTPEWFQDTQDYYDGIIITVFLSRFGTSWYNGTQVDDAIGNIHAIGVSSVACLPAGKYLHLTLMRHGSVYQIMDPWATSWYSDVWQNSVPRGIALGETIGEIYAEGIKKVGIQYIADEEHQWWWDLAENVCLFGDPNLRPWVPSTQYSSNNHWSSEDVQPLRYDADLMIDGHTLFTSATEHPNQYSPMALNPLYLLIILTIIILVAIVVVIERRKK